jgi:hypothetical protein
LSGALAPILTSLVFLLVIAPAFGQSGGDGSRAAPEAAVPEKNGATDSADHVARQLANPNNSLASLTFKNQYWGYDGYLPDADKQDNYILLFQPVFPFRLPPLPDGATANLFVRPALPFLVEQPVPEAKGGSVDFDGVTALGDIGFDIGYGVTEKNGLLWAFGMVGTLPTATDNDVSGKQLRLGPEALFAKIEKWGLYGIFPSHQWDATGWGGAYFSTTQVQWFLRFLPGGGWSIGSTPIMKFDWNTEDWTVPLNITAGRTVVFDNMPWKLEVELNYYVQQPEAFGPECMLGFNVTPVVLNVLDSWFKSLL